jgi:mannitol/fructose-specific phosphotransferase system IIA component
VQVQFHRVLHTAVQQALVATGEVYADDAIKVLLAGLAASDNLQIFMLDERARALQQAFRDMLTAAAHDAVGNFALNTERQLNDFINQMHTTEENQ